MNELKTPIEIPVEVLAIVKTTAKEPLRSPPYALDHVQVNRSKGRITAAATNGVSLLSASWKTKGEKTETLVHWNKFKGKEPLVLSRIEAPPEVCPFPRWKDVIPDKSKHTLEIRVNPKLLGDVLLALANAKKDDSFRDRTAISMFLNPKNPTSPILLEAESGEIKFIGVVNVMRKETK